MKRAWYRLVFVARFAGYLANLVLWPIVFFPLCRLLKHSKRPFFDFVFVVYPGTLDQIAGYGPLWLRKHVPMISVIGVIQKGKIGKRGLVVAIPWNDDEIEKNKLHDVIVRKVEKLAAAIGATSIALAGRLPAILTQGGRKNFLNPPFVVGDKGAVFTIIRSVEKALAVQKLDPKTVRIGIVGYGFIGSRVANALLNAVTQPIRAVDPRITAEKRTQVWLSKGPEILADCDLVVVLAGKGEQFKDTVPYLKDGVIVVDDTHPQVPGDVCDEVRKKGGKVFKAVLGLEGMKFWPRLPKWEAGWLPGCCVEAVVASMKGFSTSQQEFDMRANEIGFDALEVTNKSDL